MKVAIYNQHEQRQTHAMVAQAVQTLIRVVQRYALLVNGLVWNQFLGQLSGIGLAGAVKEATFHGWGHSVFVGRGRVNTLIRKISDLSSGCVCAGDSHLSGVRVMDQL